MNTAYLLIGGNIGNKLQCLQEATRLLDELAGKVIEKSSFYETAAWGNTQQPSFINQALQLDTALTAHDLIECMLSIEQNMGRKRLEKYGPRTIDIDMLLYNHAIIQMPLLTVPHPQLVHRMFALQPLQEIAPLYLHPILKKTISQLLAECTDTLTVLKLNDAV
jgi:2-amino-4-hydroxy-6-hydroxymethyldihydropteridine diphosphokinase